MKNEPANSGSPTRPRALPRPPSDALYAARASPSPCACCPTQLQKYHPRPLPACMCKGWDTDIRQRAYYAVQHHVCVCVRVCVCTLDISVCSKGAAVPTDTMIWHLHGESGKNGWVRAHCLYHTHRHEQTQTHTLFLCLSLLSQSLSVSLKLFLSGSASTSLSPLMERRRIYGRGGR